MASDGLIHLINSGSVTLEAAGVCTRTAILPSSFYWWELTAEEAKATLDATQFCYADLFSTSAAADIPRIWSAAAACP